MRLAGIERDFQVRQVVVRGGDQRLGLRDVEIIEDAHLPRVADQHRHAVLLRVGQMLILRVAFQHDRIFAQADELLQHAHADLAQADQDHVVLVGLGHGTHPLPSGFIPAQQVIAEPRHAIQDHDQPQRWQQHAKQVQDPMVGQARQVLHEDQAVGGVKCPRERHGRVAQRMKCPAAQQHQPHEQEQRRQELAERPPQIVERGPSSAKPALHRSRLTLARCEEQTAPARHHRRETRWRAKPPRYYTPSAHPGEGDVRQSRAQIN